MNKAELQGIWNRFEGPRMHVDATPEEKVRAVSQYYASPEYHARSQERRQQLAARAEQIRQERAAKGLDEYGYPIRGAAAQNIRVTEIRVPGVQSEPAFPQAPQGAPVDMVLDSNGTFRVVEPSVAGSTDMNHSHHEPD